MQRSKIKVGEAYVVTSSTQQKGYSVVKGTVAEMDVERTYRDFSGFSSHERTAQDGIRVRFDEPVISTHGGFVTLASIDMGSWVASHKREMREKATTEAVLTSKQIKEPWADYEARERSREEFNRQAEERADEQGDAFEPRFEAMKAMLTERGFEIKTRRSYGDGPEVVEVKTSESIGTERDRIIGATWNFTTGGIEKALGLDRDGVSA